MSINFITPNTVIKVLTGVPLDPSYEHTIYFASSSDQTDYFEGKVKYTFQKQTYQRVNKGTLRIEKKAEDLYNCNYLMFQNASFGSKWFYAFITQVEYINDIVSEVSYEIDVMQTWFFNYTLKECFVERQHSPTDKLFENIVPENIEIGDEYVNNDDPYTVNLNDMRIVALLNRKRAGGAADASHLYNNIYTPLKLVGGVEAKVYPGHDGPAIMDGLLDAYQEDEVIGIYQYPAVCGDLYQYDPYVNAFNMIGDIPFDNYFSSIDGYYPKNKKLFTYPYNMILASNNSGQTAVFRWEDWEEGHEGSFEIQGVYITNPEFALIPKYYRGLETDFDDALILTNFPKCAWSGDIFKAWWAQNKASFVTSGLTSVMSNVTGGLVAGAALQGTAEAGLLTLGEAAAGPVGWIMAGVGVLTTIASSVAKVQDIKNTPSQIHGHTQTESLTAGIKRIQYDLYPMCIKEEFAMIVDDFFSKFGYAVKKIQVPQINVRPHWTYVKTVGCVLTAKNDGLPAEAEKAIISIYDNGITFWTDGDEVGDYSLVNSPVTPNH